MMPNVASAMRRFQETMQFQIVKKTVVDHDLVETSKIPVPLWFEGNLQPLHPHELLVKPEGERKFKWWTLYTDLVLTVDTVIKDQDGLIYRVMASSDWQDAGFTQYQLIEGPGL